MMDRKSKAEAISPAPDDFQMTNAQASLFFATVAVLALKAPVELCMLAFCCTFWHARVSFDEFEKGDGKMRTDQEEVSIVSLDNISAPTVNCRTQECSPFFTRFPPEIRNQIYRCLLISKHNGIIERPDILLKFKTKQLVFMARAADRIPFELGIRTAIIHTCCQAYMEALPILYGENIFEFSGAKELDVFKQHGLRTSSKVKSRKQGSELPLFRLNPCLQGRLSHIRKLRLDITENALNESSVQRKRRRYPRPLWGTRPDRTQIASDWELLMSDRTDRILFPSLEQLSLDFVDLGLETEECVAVRPFADMLRGTSGLKLLTINGIANPKNLEQFRKSLLRPNWEFNCGMIIDGGEDGSESESDDGWTSSDSNSESDGDENNDSDES